MATQTLLHLDAGQLVAWRWRKGTLQQQASFPADQEGLTAFGAWLPLQGTESCALLADVAEETFLAEAIPFVRGKDRQALVKRKLQQAFHGSPLTLFRSLGRDKAGRHDEHMLFLGLPHGAFFEPWLSALRARRVPLSGLYTGALIADMLGKQLPFTAPRFLLMNLGRAGIRLSFFDAGRLRFSHLKPFPHTDASTLAVACAEEASRICDYLHGQRLAPRGAPLPCLVLTHPEHHGVFATHCSNTPDVEFLLLDLAATSRRLGLVSPQEDSSADGLWLHLLASHPPREQYAPANERHVYRLRQVARASAGTAAALCAAGLLYAGAEVWQGLGLAEDTLRDRALAAKLESRYRQRMATLPPLPVQADKLRAIATRYTQLEQRSTQPLEMFKLISGVLDRFPEVELERLEWTLSTTGDKQPAAGAPAPGPATPPMIAAATLKCSLPPGKPADTVEAFVSALREDTSLSINVLGHSQADSPILRGSSQEQAALPTRFELRISRRL